MYKITGEFINIENMDNTPLNYFRIDNHFNNTDPIKMSNSDFNTCKNACDIDMACTNFSFNPTNNNNICLQYSKSDNLVNDSDNSIYVKVFDVYDKQKVNLNREKSSYSANNFTNIAPNSNVVDSCASICASSNECNMYQAYHDISNNYMNCSFYKNNANDGQWLLQDDSESKSTSTFIKKKNTVGINTSYNKGRTYKEYKINYPDVNDNYNTDINKIGIKVSNRTDCQNICDKTPSCKAYVLNKDNICYLKKSADYSTDDSFVSTWIADDPNFKPDRVYNRILSTDYPNNDLSQINNSSVNDCNKSCNTAKECKGFVFTSNKTCWLKNKIDLTLQKGNQPGFTTYVKPSGYPIGNPE